MSEALDRARWSSLCARLGCAALDDRFGTLASAYAEPHRHYHTATHVRECLDLLDGAAHLAARPDELEFAIWLHDAVYGTSRSDNEERSAGLAEGWLRACGVAEPVPGRVRGLVLATRHAAPPEGGDEALLQDIDLAILGSPPERYREYEKQIRREYRWVPGPLFRARRVEILAAFLAREPLYRTAWFRERFEAAARRNLQGALRALRPGT